MREDGARKDDLPFKQVIIDAIPAPIFYKDADGIYLGCNQAFERFLGLPGRRIIGKTVYDVSPKDLADTYRKADNALLKEGGTQVYESEVVYADGTRHNVVFNKATFSSADGSTGGLIGIIFDITQRKKAEAELRRISGGLEVLANERTAELTRINKALRDSEWKFRAIFDQTFQFIGLLTIDGTLIEVNRSALGVIEARESDILGKPFWETPWWTHSPELQEKLRWAIGRAAEGNVERFEATHRAVDGSIRYVDFSIKPVRDESGRVILLIPEGRDITERKLTEKALEDAKNQAELYVDLMSHDIGNMNHAIMGYLELAMDTLEMNEGQKELLEKPIELINKSTSLIRNVKKLQQLKTGKRPEEVKDLGQAMLEACSQIKHGPGKEITINYTPVSGCLVMADGLLQDVFANLVDNSIKHSQGAVTINMGLARAFEDGRSYYKATIEDDGPGMPDELKSHVLDRLCLVKLGATGRGMGLCVAKALVDSYGGKISVEDRVPGDHKHGCRFTVTLPAIE